ncbi:MAG: hypothetical protein QOE07_755 [Acidimicrobiaceae bacterium]|nr:hypothetical protein [Acidimicrobiaceae bacterium]
MVSQQPRSARDEVVLAVPRDTKKSGKDESLPAEFKELIDLIVTYAKQQTIDPLKLLLRWVAFGVAGALMISLGFLLAGVGLLRALESEAFFRRHLGGNWSWLPYLITVIFLGAVIGLMVRRISHGPGSEER